MWIAPIVAWVDGLGYQRCAACADTPEARIYPRYGDTGFDADDVCDRCGCQIEQTRERIHADGGKLHINTSTKHT